MQVWEKLLANKILISAVAAWLAAQGIKTALYSLINKKFSWERLTGSGGMPSSHAATVCALATASALEYGLSSFEFAVSLILAAVVMYDARGVRYESGRQATVLNWILSRMEPHPEEKPIDQLKEFIGHTLLQVVMGAILGIAVAVFLD
ncbi:MAG: divergent PAP2 family protein [Peptococcaceae bacterium]|nr:divergent PAP2 family protein [Peptococcaceae bacterium]